MSDAWSRLLAKIIAFALVYLYIEFVWQPSENAQQGVHWTARLARKIKGLASRWFGFNPRRQ